MTTRPHHTSPDGLKRPCSNPENCKWGTAAEAHDQLSAAEAEYQNEKIIAEQQEDAGSSAFGTVSTSDDGGWSNLQSVIDNGVEVEQVADAVIEDSENREVLEEALDEVGAENVYEIAEETYQDELGDSEARISDLPENERNARLKEVFYMGLAAVNEEKYLQDKDKHNSVTENLADKSYAKSVSGPYIQEDVNNDFNEDINTAQVLVDRGNGEVSRVNFDRVSSGAFNPSQAEEYIKENKATYQSRYEQRAIREDGLASEPLVLTDSEAGNGSVHPTVKEIQHEEAEKKFDSGILLGSNMESPKTWQQYRSDDSSDYDLTDADNAASMFHYLNAEKSSIRENGADSDADREYHIKQEEAHNIASETINSSSLPKNISFITSEKGKMWDDVSNKYTNVDVYRAYDRQGEELFVEHSRGDWAKSVRTGSPEVKDRLDEQGSISLDRVRQWSEAVNKYDADAPAPDRF